MHEWHVVQEHDNVRYLTEKFKDMSPSDEQEVILTAENLDSALVKSAKSAESKHWKRNNVYGEIPYSQQSAYRSGGYPQKCL